MSFNLNILLPPHEIFNYIDLSIPVNMSTVVVAKTCYFVIDKTGQALFPWKQHFYHGSYHYHFYLLTIHEACAMHIIVINTKQLSMYKYII